MLCRYDRQKGKLMNQNNKFKGIFIYLAVIVLLVIGMVTMLQMSATPGEHTTYSKVISEFDNYNVSGYTLDLGSGELQYTLKSDNTKKYKYSVPNVSLFLQDTQGYRKAYNEKNPDSQLVAELPALSADGCADDRIYIRHNASGERRRKDVAVLKGKCKDSAFKRS